MTEKNTIPRRRVLQTIGATGIAGFAGCMGDGNGTGNGTGNGGGNDGQLVIETAAGSPGGTGYVIMNALMSSASASYPGLTYNILPGGWVGNNERLQDQELDIGHTTMVAGSLAESGIDPYDADDWENDNLRSIMADQSELFYYVVAQPDFPYDTMQEAAEDDYPLTVTNQPEGSFGGLVWDTALEELGYDQETIEELGGDYRRTSWDDMAQMFVDEDIDAILAVSGRSVGWLETITATRDVEFLQWSEDNREFFNESYGLLPADLEPGTLPVQDETLHCMQDSGLVNAQADAPYDPVYSIVDGVIQNAEQVRDSTDVLSPFEADESMHEEVPLDLHEAARDAYEDNGLL